MGFYRAKERALIAQLVIDLHKTIHAGRLGYKRPFVAADVETVLVSGVVLLGHAQDKPKNATEIGRAIGVPRATVLRKLEALEKMGIVERRGSKFFMAPTLRPGDDDYIDKCMALIKRAAEP